VYQTYKVCSPSNYNTTPWGPVRRISGELTTYEDLWNMLNQEIEKDENGNPTDGIYAFTADGQ
jgi:hypothetical protein